MTVDFVGADRPVGGRLREWRERRRLTQLDLSLRADVSTRHLSYVETGRSRPTSALILRLAEQLDVPLRERNVLLTSGGYAPAYPTHSLDAPPMAAVHEAIEHVLNAHLPFPAVVIDAGWDMIAGNSAIGLFIDGIPAHLLEPPVNVLRLSLHPDGLADRIINLAEWRAHLLDRLEREAASTADPGLRALADELAGYPAPPVPQRRPDTRALLVPLRLRHGRDELSFLSMTTVFGTPRDVTLAELAIESFYPADERTAAILRAKTG
jgi:transcriptional regulator with XRE-family HTH domain